MHADDDFYDLNAADTIFDVKIDQITQLKEVYHSVHKIVVCGESRDETSGSRFFLIVGQPTC